MLEAVLTEDPAARISRGWISIGYSQPTGPQDLHADHSSHMDHPHASSCAAPYTPLPACKRLCLCSHLYLLLLQTPFGG